MPQPVSDHGRNHSKNQEIIPHYTSIWEREHLIKPDMPQPVSDQGWSHSKNPLII